MEVNKVYDANVYINDISTHGMASEVTCPNVTAVMSDYNALGMVGSVEFFNGFDKMEATIKWTYPSNEIKSICANFMKSVDIMVRASKQTYTSEGVSTETPIVIIMRGLPKQHPGGSFKKGEDTEVESTFSVNYYKETIDGEDIVEIDVLNNIYKVDGVDLLSSKRQNLGI